MAGLDTSIPLGIRPVDFGDPNEGRLNALRAQMMQMQMQQGQFNMMKAQRDMEYQDQQRAQAAAAAARDKAAEKDAINAFLKTAQPGSSFNPNPNTPYAPANASAEGSGAFPGWNNAQPPDMNATIQQLVNAGKFDAAKKMMGQNQAFNVNTESNLKVQKETAGAAEAGYKASDAELGNFDKNYDTFRKQAMTIASPQEAAAWTSAMYDNPTLGKMMSQMGMSKEQAVAKAAQEYAADPQKWVAAHMNLSAKDAYEAVHGTIKEKANNPTKTQQLQEYRDQLKAQLDKNPNNEMLQQKYDEAHAAVMRETRYGDRGLPPLDKGYTYDKEGNAVLIPGSKADRDERLKAVGDRKKVVGNTGQLDEAVKNIDEILDPKNAKAFNDNFGGYVQKTTADKLTGETATTYNKIQQLKANTAKLGLDDFRVNGSIGAMTEKEWPLVQAAIASLDPKMPAADAARAIKGIRDKMQRMKDDAVDTYNLQWGGTKYHTPIKGGTGVQFGGAAPATAPAQGEVVQWGDLK